MKIIARGNVEQEEEAAGKGNHKHAKPKHSAVIYDICMRRSCIFIQLLFFLQLSAETTDFLHVPSFFFLHFALASAGPSFMIRRGQGAVRVEGHKCKMPNNRGPEINSEWEKKRKKQSEK